MAGSQGGFSGQRECWGEEERSLGSHQTDTEEASQEDEVNEPWDNTYINRNWLI